MAETAKNPTLVSQILEWPKGTPVCRFEGEVVDIFDQKSGTNTKGQWSIQKVVMVDIHGNKITLMLKDRAPWPFPKGSPVALIANEGTRGFTGLYCEDDDYQGKVTRMLKVTATATVSPLGHQNYSQPQDTGHAPQGQHAPPRTQEPAREPERPREPETRRQTTTQAPAEGHDDLKDAKREIMKIANLHLICAVAVERYEAPAIKAATGMEMTEQARQAATSSLFIQGARDGLLRKMPNRRLAEDEL